MKPHQPRTSRCSCGSVEFSAADKPIVGIICYCADCQTAGGRIEALEGAPPICRTDGGTEFLLFRKDRVKCVAGEDLLVDHQLDAASPTRRMVASCCNSMVALNFTKGHWLSMNRARFGSDAPPVEFGIMTKDAPAANLAGIPAYKSFPIKFVGRLMLAKAVMLFGR